MSDESYGLLTSFGLVSASLGIFSHPLFEANSISISHSCGLRTLSRTHSGVDDPAALRFSGGVGMDVDGGELDFACSIRAV